MEQQVIGLLKLNKAFNEVYRKVKDVESHVQTNLLKEQQDMEKTEFKFLNFTAECMEFRKNIKLNSEQINTIEAQNKDF